MFLPAGPLQVAGRGRWWGPFSLMRVLLFSDRGEALFPWRSLLGAGPASRSMEQKTQRTCAREGATCQVSRQASGKACVAALPGNSESSSHHQGRSETCQPSRSNQFIIAGSRVLGYSLAPPDERESTSAFTGPVYCWEVSAMLPFPEPSGHSRGHQGGDHGSPLSLLSLSRSLPTVNYVVTQLCKGCLCLSFSLSDLLRSMTSDRPCGGICFLFFSGFFFFFSLFPFLFCLPPGNCRLRDSKPLTNTVYTFPWFIR